MRRMTTHNLKIFSGSVHTQLATEIAEILNVKLGKSTTTHLPDSEIHVMIDEVVREQDVFLIHPCAMTINDSIMELLLYLDAFRRASAHRINVVIPYFPYARQDRMARGREAISARVIANLIESQGATRVVFIDIHNLAIQGFFNIPVDPLSAVPVLANYFMKPEFKTDAIVSPDVGRASMAAKYAERLNLPLVVMHKRRMGGDATKTTHVVGDIRGRRPVIIDDLIAGGSVLTQLDALYKEGAEGKAYFSITHPVLLPTAIKLLQQDDRIEKLVTTNTLPISNDKIVSKIEVLSIAPLLAAVIDNIYHGKSIINKLELG